MEREHRRENTVTAGILPEAAVNRRRFDLPAGPRGAARRPRLRKTRVSFHLTHDLAERIRNAVYQLSGPPHRLTMAALAEAALRREVERLEREANQAAPFPSRANQLIGGRTVGT